MYGWVGNGIVLNDARAPTAPRIVDQVHTGGGVWDATAYRAYVFTADDVNGLGVFRPE